jgi:diguanylate cyclase (GGDEF)-like protein
MSNRKLDALRGILGELTHNSTDLGLDLSDVEPSDLEALDNYLKELKNYHGAHKAMVSVFGQLVRGTEVAVRDPLTGVHSELYYNSRSAEEFAKSMDSKSPLTLLLLDIDHFKDINDDCGRPGGDQVLHTVGQAIKYTVGDRHIAARLGGGADEFAVLAPETTLADGVELAELIRNRIQRSISSYDRNNVHATVSGGVAVHPYNGRITSYAQLYADAGKALTLAKRDRNVVRSVNDVKEYI